MWEQQLEQQRHGKDVAGKVGGDASIKGGEVPAGSVRVVADKMEQSMKLLTELAEHAGKVAPEYKHIFDDAKAAISDYGALLLHGSNGSNGSVTRIVAPMPGIVIRCEKRVGDDVRKGDVVLVLDAMKVENPIRVPVTGRLISMRHGEGQRVSKGAVLAVVNQ